MLASMKSETAGKAVSHFEGCIIGSAALLVFLLLWFPHLGGTLWLDETLSYWVVKDSFSDALRRSWSHHGQSPLYYLCLWLVVQIAGDSELSLRILSLISVAAGLLVLFKVYVALFDRRLAIYTILSFFCLGLSSSWVYYARPYGLAFFLSLFSFWQLLKWSRTPNWFSALAYTLSAVALIYCHYLFALVLFAHLGFFLGHSVKQPKALKKVLRVTAVALVLLFPLFPQLVSLLGRKESLDWGYSPSSLEYAEAFLAPWTSFSLLAALAVAWMAGELKWQPIYLKRLHTRAQWWVLIWWLAPVLGCVLLSASASVSIVASRYYVGQIPALSILCGLVLTSLGVFQVRVIAAVAFALFSLATAQVYPNWIEENWASPAKYIKRLDLDRDVPILLFTGLIESYQVDWLSDPGEADYLSAPLVYYETGHPIYLLPLSIQESDSKVYWNDRVVPLIGARTQLLLVVNQSVTWRVGGEATAASEGYLKSLEVLGFKIRTSSDTGKVKVFHLEAKVPPLVSSELGTRGRDARPRPS